MTETGHNDFHERFKNKRIEKTRHPLKLIEHRALIQKDELEQINDELAEEFLMNSFEQNENLEEELSVSSENSEPLSDLEFESESEVREVPRNITQKQKFAKLKRILLNEEELDEESEEEISVRDNDKQDEPNYSFISYVVSAKDWLKSYLQNIGYSTKSIEIILREFNTYLDEPHPFYDYRTSTVVGFSWRQIKQDKPRFAPIAEVAQKLHSSGVSEASCERSISEQRLIFASRRRNSKRDLLDARFIIMNSDLEEIEML